MRRKRFEVECDNDDELIKRLPEHATHLFTCLECKRIPNAMVDEKSKMNPHNELGLAQTMLRVGGRDDAPEVRCARRSSAALRTALSKESDAASHRIECLAVDRAKLRAAIDADGDSTHAARLRRDLRTCCEQHEKALACGDRPLVKVSILGKVVKMQNRFFALCSFCASIVQVSQLKRFHGDICCGRCDLSMISETPPGASTAAARVAVRYEVSSSRPAPAPFASVALASKLRCRFCNKHPPNSLTASKFRILRAPSDTFGRNANLPPPLRMIALCQSHYRPWLEEAVFLLPMHVIFAHISERAAPIFGADSAKPVLTIQKRSSSTVAHKTLMRRVREKSRQKK